MELLERALAQHPFLAGLDRRYARQLAGLASPKSFDAHQMIFDEGQPANEFYLVCKARLVPTFLQQLTKKQASLVGVTGTRHFPCS